MCDKGGECPLQDQTLAYGPGESRIVEEKRHFEKPIPISDLVQLDRERCILCDRCTRFAKEVAGDPLIHFQDRGNQTQVNTFPDHPFASYFSGNTVQICPVGALTATPYRFKARPWDLEQVESTCTSCSVGCRVVVDSSRNQVLRYHGVDIDPVNWGWLCDKGRFDFEAVSHADRLGRPLVRPTPGGELAEARWSEALGAAAVALLDGLERSGPPGVAVLGGARLTNEAAYAWAKLAKGVIGTDNVDAQLGDGLPADIVLGLPRATIDEVCAPGGTVLAARPRPEGGAAGPVPAAAPRRRRGRREGRRAVARTDRPRRRSRSRRVRYRPGEAAEALDALLGDGAAPAGADADSTWPRAIERARARARSPSSSGGPRWPSRGADVAAAASAILRRPARRPLPAGPAPGQRPRRPRHGPRPGPAARPGHPRRRPRLVRRPRGTRCPPSRASTAPASSQAAADGRIDTLVLLGADPLADFPDRELAAAASPAPARSSPSTSSSPRRRPRPTSCCRRPAPPRSAAPPPTSRAASACSARRSRRPAPPGPTG